MMSTPVLADKMDDDIKVEVEDGVATLSGTVHEDSHKTLAQETVASLPCVTSVDNKLDIEGERPAEKSDEWLVAKVKTTLLFYKT